MVNNETSDRYEKLRADKLDASLRETKERLQEAEETLEAIRNGAVDGLVRRTPSGNQIFMLKGSEQPYRNLIEEMTEGAILLSDSGTILYCNQGFAKLVDATLNRVMGRSIMDWLSKSNANTFTQLVSSVKAGMGKTVYNIALQTTKNQLIPTHISINRILIGSINASVLIITDLSKHMAEEVKSYTANLEIEITERKKAEQELDNYRQKLEKLVEERTKQLKDAERLAAIGATAGMVGHDIRNPLQAIVSDLYIAKDELKELPDNKKFKEDMLETIEAIETNIFYINKIVADLQDFARPLMARAQEADLKSVIDGIIVANHIPENVRINFEVEPQAQFVIADPDFLKRIVSNLILNACQAMPNGGKLSINLLKDNALGDIVLTVQDNGVGIPNDVKDKLFTPMFTTKSKGQGFGLAVVKRMTEALGGTVSFESEIGKSTKFIVRLPPQS